MGCNTSSQATEENQEAHRALDNPRDCDPHCFDKSPLANIDKSMSKKRKLRTPVAIKSPNVSTLIRFKKKIMPESLLEIDSLADTEANAHTVGVSLRNETGEFTPSPYFRDTGRSTSRDKHLFNGKAGKRFILGEQIGEGHYATVYMAWDADTGLPYACKKVSKKVDPKQMQEELKEQMSVLAQTSHTSTVIPSSLSQSTVVQSRASNVQLSRSSTLPLQDTIPREVRIMWHLDHPYILQCIDYWEDEERIYMVTDLMRGGALLERLVEKKRYSEDKARELVQGLLESLVHLHERNIVHRDLKPDNILLATISDDVAFKLADFGLSGHLLVEGQKLTRACGTPGYVAPELVNRQPYGTSVDVWAVGVITFALLGGYHPFYSDDEQKVYRRVRKVEFNFDYHRWDAISEEAKSFIRSILVADPEVRPSASQALQHPWFGS